MHNNAATLLIISVIFISVIVVSGCLSGQTTKRQAAEPADNLSLQATVDYGEDVAEDVAEEQVCSCLDSVRTCPDGFSATCENECDNSTCQRCMPSCAGHEKCNESWFCGEWSSCSGGQQARRCIDSSFCNKTGMAEERACPDACMSDSDCPAEHDCMRYFCEGTPKSCVPYVDVSCPEQQSAPCDQTQCPQCPQCNETAQQNQTQNTTAYYSNVSITNITYKAPEFVEIWNLGNRSADITNWTLTDNSSHTYVFPVFLLQAGAQVKVHTESGTNNITDLFWGRNCPGRSTQCIWNDGGDVATLRDRNGDAASAYSY